MAELKERFKNGMDDFPSFFQFFEYNVRNCLSEMLEDGRVVKGVSSGSILTRSKGNLCTFGTLRKSNSKSSGTGDLIFKMGVPGLKFDAKEMVQNNIQECPSLRLFVMSANIDQYNNIYFFLNRKTLFKHISKMVITAGSNYGQENNPTNIGRHILINCGDVDAAYDSKDEFTIGQFRTVLLCDHMAEILKQNRCKAQLYFPGYSYEKDRDITPNDVLLAFGVPHLNIGPVSSCKSTYEQAHKVLMENLCKTQYRAEESERSTCKYEQAAQIHYCQLHHARKEDSSNKAITQDAGALDDAELDKCIFNNLCLSDDVHWSGSGQVRNMKDYENIKLNVFKFVEDLKKASYMKGFCVFDAKNLQEVNVLSVWEDLLYLEEMELKTRPQNGKADNRKIIHFSGQEKQFHSQKVGLTWRLLTESNLAAKQTILCHGSGAFCKKTSCMSGSVSVSELLRIRTKQVKHSYFLKYGSSVNEESWSTTIAKMAISVIKLEILQAPLKSRVQLDVTDTDECPVSCRQALFVLYNCARLAKILEHYHDAVNKEIYPPLPDVNEIDFSYLKDEAEWNLFMKYVVSYPDVVANVGQELQDSALVGKFTSNKVTHFLFSLSQDFSVYYSRVHVLGEPRTHLLPVMFARLYLVKALYQVIQNALQLLSIEPIDQM